MLIDLWRRHGARTAESGDRETVRGFTSLEEEHRALTSGWALADRSSVEALELRGEDRVRFLNGQLTCDIAALEVGRGVYGFFTNHQGRVLSDGGILALADRLLVELPPQAGERMAEQLGKYIIADRVELAVPEGLSQIVVAGARSEERLSGLVDLPPDGAWSHGEVELGGERLLAVRHPRLGVPAVALWAEEGPLRAAAEALLEGAAGDAPALVGEEGLEAVRVEAGTPRFGHDFSDENFPQETGVEGAVSYSKGCYLGQEVVARIHYRGQVNRVLRGLRFDGEEPPVPGTELLLDGRAVGKVGSAVRSVRLGAPIGLAIVHRRGAEPGTRLELGGGGVAEVTDTRAAAGSAGRG